MGASEPLAVTVNVTLAPGLTVALAGWEVIRAPPIASWSPWAPSTRDAVSAASMANMKYDLIRLVVMLLCVFMI